MPARGPRVQRPGAGGAPAGRRLSGPGRVRRDTEITRKSFISGSSAALAALTLLPRAALGAAPEDSDGSAHALRRSVGERFDARGARGVLVPLLLERDVDAGSDATAERFSLFFSAEEGFSLKEGTWTLVSAGGQRRYEVFLVPAGTDPAGRQVLRADFCLLGASTQRPTRR